MSDEEIVMTAELRRLYVSLHSLCQSANGAPEELIVATTTVYRILEQLDRLRSETLRMFLSAAACKDIRLVRAHAHYQEDWEVCSGEDVQQLIAEFCPPLCPARQKLPAKLTYGELIDLLNTPANLKISNLSLPEGRLYLTVNGRPISAEIPED